MSGRKANQQRNIHRIKGLGDLLVPQLVCDGKQSQHIESVILRFVAKIGNALFGQGIILAIPEDIVHIQSRLVLRNDDAGSK